LYIFCFKRVYYETDIVRHERKINIRDEKIDFSSLKFSCLRTGKKRLIETSIMSTSSERQGSEWPTQTSNIVWLIDLSPILFFLLLLLLLT